MAEKVIVASSNKNKLQEIKDILKEFDFEIVSMGEAGINADIEETGETFEENALIKAEHIHMLTGNLVIADDSGLMVDALNGEPGVRSARYGGEHGDDEANNKKLIKALEVIPDHERTARFVCSVAVVHGNGRSFVVNGEVEGEILREPAGENGFGYDPLFYLPSIGKTMAQLSGLEKNKISHRGAALKKMVKELKKL